MNKIFAFFIGVTCWTKALSAFAVEKFEVLPDLPDPLAYAVQPASASTITGNANVSSVLGSTQSVGSEPSMISVVLSLVFVILLIYLTGIIYAKLNKVGFKTMKRQQGELAKSQVSVLSTTQLGSNKTLHVVELDGKRMLIGASSSAIQLIKDLGSYNEGEFEEEYSKIEIPNIKIPRIEIPKIEIPSIGFSKIMTKAHKKFEMNIEEPVVETDSDSDIQNVSEQVPTIEENPEGIIDSLFAQQASAQTESEPTVSSAAEHKVDPDEFALYKKYLGA